MNSQAQSKPWTILGAGAIGCLWAYQGLQAGRDISLILRNEDRLATFQAQGGVSAVHQGLKTTLPCPALLPNQVQSPVSQLLVCCKAQQTTSALEQIADKLADDAIVLLLQNGMGVADEVRSQWPGLKVFAGITTDGVHLVAPFTIQRAGYGVTRIGLYPSDESGDASREAAAALGFPGLAIEACKDIHHAQWQKLAVNIIINPLTALYDIRNGELPRHPEASTFIRPLAKEIALAATAEGMALQAEDIEQWAMDACQRTAANISSMLQDIRHGRTSEIGYINGYLQRVAEKHGLELPNNRALLQRIGAMSSQSSPD